MKRVIPSLLLSLFGLCQAQATSNIVPSQAHAWSSSRGWVHFQTDPTEGAALGEYTSSGHLFIAECGWIQLGDGTPQDGIRYGQSGSDDYGVNRLSDGRLRGYAFSRELGWLHFEDTGNPRVDPVSGVCSGYAWSPSLGWIDLGDATHFVQVSSIQAAPDTDSDGMADAWELETTGDLTTFSQTSDSDGDTLSDAAEYAAGSDPNDPQSRFALASQNFNQGSNELNIAWIGHASRVYQVEVSNDLQSWTPQGSPQQGTGSLQQQSVPISDKTFVQLKVSPLLP